MERIELYYKKLEILTCHINKFIDKSTLENKELLETNIEKDKNNIKTFLAKTLPNKDNFRKQSTKIFLTDYYIYNGLKKIWTDLDINDKAIVWNLLFEMFILSVQIFPIVKPTEYIYVSIYLLLEENKTDISLPKLPALTIVSALSKESISHISREFEEGKISKSMIDHLLEEFKADGISTLQQVESMKQKFKDLMEKKEIKHIIDIFKKYFTEYIVERLIKDCKSVFDNKSFQKFTQQYDKNKIISMIQNKELNFVNVRQMVYDSGITELLGEDFEFPTCFQEFIGLIKKYTGKDIQENDLKGFFEENLKNVSDTPYFKKFINNSGFKHLLNPILDMFKKPDHSASKLKRKLKRRKQATKQINSDSVEEPKT